MGTVILQIERSVLLLPSSMNQWHSRLDRFSHSSRKSLKSKMTVINKLQMMMQNNYRNVKICNLSPCMKW